MGNGNPKNVSRLDTLYNERQAYDQREISECSECPGDDGDLHSTSGKRDTHHSCRGVLLIFLLGLHVVSETSAHLVPLYHF